jgi:D-alanyl-D-alanine carboxypeptidase
MHPMPTLLARRAALLAVSSLLLAGSLAPSAAAQATPPGSTIAAPPPDLGSVVATLFAAASPAPATVVSPAARLPACEVRDEATRYGAVREWRRTLLDTNLRLRRKYEPWDLVSVSRAGLAGSGQVRKLIIEDLTALAQAARDAGKALAVRSAYRSYETQAATFQMWVNRSGYEQALKFSARAGHSEHQLGTTIDFTTAPGVPLSGRFGDSPSGKWLARNGWKFGFIMSYPEGKRRVSCYGYEPWHWRYVGRDLARQIHESGQVPRRFLWENSESLP